MLAVVAAAPAPRVSSIDRCAFDQLNEAAGDLRLMRASAVDGRPVARARFRGGTGNAFARGVHDVSWPDGEQVSYGVDMFLRPGFHDRVQGQVDLLRWDNFPSRGEGADWGGIVVFGSDRRARLVRFGGGRPETNELVGPFDLPEGRWFRLMVHQRLSDGPDAESAVEIDGARIGTSTDPNTYGRAIERVRYGIVAVAAGAQRLPLEVFVHAPDSDPHPPGDRVLCVSRQRFRELSRGG